MPRASEAYRAPGERRGSLEDRGSLETLGKMEPKEPLESKGKRVRLGLACRDPLDKMGLKV